MIASENNISRRIIHNPDQVIWKVAVLDDHPAIMWGISTLIKAESDFNLVAFETSQDRFFAQISAAPCDIAVIDYYMPGEGHDGAHYIKRLRGHFPGLKIVVYSAVSEQDMEYLVCKAGANAFLAKKHPLSLVAEMIRAVAQDSRRFYGIKAGRCIAYCPQAAIELLTASEIEILRHISAGYSVTQIAAKQRRSKKTVSTHKRCAMRKLGCEDDLSLALFLKERFR